MDVASQTEFARRAVLVVAARDRAVLAVKGGDRITWLNGLVTCDLAKARPGDALYGLAVGKNGRVLADFVALVDSDQVLLAVPAAVADSLRSALEHYLVMEDAELAPAPLAAWLAHGPRAGEVLAASGGRGGAVDLTGLGGAVIFGQPEAGEAIAAAARAAGGGVGDDAGWDALRLEQGVPRFGVDFDATTYPQEAGLEKTAVSFSKGCYLGQEVVCMLEMRGHVKRKLAPLIIDSREVPARGAKVTAEGAEVGEITSAALSPTLGRAVALAMVKRAHAEPGTALAVGASAAQVAARPVS